MATPHSVQGVAPNWHRRISIFRLKSFRIKTFHVSPKTLQNRILRVAVCACARELSSLSASFTWLRSWQCGWRLTLWAWAGGRRASRVDKTIFTKWGWAPASDTRTNAKIAPHKRFLWDFPFRLHRLVSHLTRMWRQLQKYTLCEQRQKNPPKPHSTRLLSKRMQIYVQFVQKLENHARSRTLAHFASRFRRFWKDEWRSDALTWFFFRHWDATRLTWIGVGHLDWLLRRAAMLTTTWILNGRFAANRDYRLTNHSIIRKRPSIARMRETTANVEIKRFKSTVNKKNAWCKRQKWQWSMRLSLVSFLSLRRWPRTTDVRISGHKIKECIDTGPSALSLVSFQKSCVSTPKFVVHILRRWPSNKWSEYG